MNLTIPRLNLLFLLAWLALLLVTYLNSYDDPSSIFYRESRSYEQRYSRIRAHEADLYLADPPPKQPSPTEEDNKFLCIGIPSINRTTQSFLKHTIGTLVDTLTLEERGGIHLVVLLADRPARKHSAYGEEWLEKVVDEVLVYDDPPAEDEGKVYRKVPFELVEGRERGDGRVENMRLDHSLLVETCMNYGAEYFVLVEDDIVAGRDWFQRLRKGLGYATAMGFGLWLPALIALYFLSGRVSTSRVNPFMWTSHGVREMMNYGCCAQGLLFPKRQLPGVFKLMRYPPYRFPGDMILEGYAGDHGLRKWALDPSVFQHVGFTESSAGPRRAEVWNFSFERMQPKGWLWGS
ncbi:hypothetical protein QBC40DRAFT_348643 [Triangularia verruculosa]|uniref:Uncharacterized protein n=1 Tax=Triangularia verruculosa TaxID=2587418 RepID=A0AAN6XH34_9PEZI|nr:hypothetical protein QBC40DRAFT_348643 [Triangularia verruculosa]